MIKDFGSFFCEKESSLVQPEKLVEWKKQHKKYNFDSLPNTAIISVFPLKKDSLTFFKTKRVKGIKGKNFLINKQQLLLATECGYGAPYIVNLCEELRVLGVSNFIFIGLAGAISSNIKEGELLYVNKVFSGVGSSYYYKNNEVFLYNNYGILEEIINQLKISPVTCWSTDAPFRETLSLKDDYVNQGAEIVEMETAAVYAFADFYKLSALCLMIISDVIEEEWHPPVNYQKLRNKEQDVIATIIKRLNKSN